MLKQFGYLLLTSLWLNAAFGIDLPQMGDSSGATISAHEEKELGEAFMREVRRSVEIIDDPEIVEYAQNLGGRLTAYAVTDTPNFSFFVVKDGSVNAFAGPGGYVGIHSGLILTTDNESELASVVAHEISHVTQRHLPRAIEQASKLNIPTTAALIAALVLGRNDHNLSEAALAATLAGHQQSQINFTRGNEQEADSIGIELVEKAGFDPRGMPDFFERLQQTYRFYDNNLPEFLSTHPVTVNRIADSRARAEQYPTPKTFPETSYAYVQAKLRILTSKSSSDALEFFKARLGHGDRESQNVAHYGYALALSQAGNASEARKIIGKLLEADPEKIGFINLAALVEYNDHNYSGAIKILKDALSLYPEQHALTMLYADSLIKNGQAELARQLLRDHLRKYTPTPATYKLYAEAAGEAGFKVDTHQAMAEYYYSIGETATAAKQLTAALQTLRDEKKNDFYTSSRLEARLREFKAEMEKRNEKQ